MAPRAMFIRALVVRTMAKKPETTTGLFPSGQIRLRQLSVYNWGSFQGVHTAPIDPEGTLITGDNGSGKSTLVDGLMALLQPAGRATFNVAAAQGDRHDRTLMSYIRGHFGSERDGLDTRAKAKREGATASALRAYYLADDGRQITLAAVFWTTAPSNAISDLKRHYLVAKRDMTLTELLKAFGDGDTRALKAYLRDDASVCSCDDRFRDYQETYQRLLHIENRNAPALLARALGLKKIDDLTLLIRELVLEPSAVREDARKAVNEFADLHAIHNQLADARAQQTALKELPKIDTAWRTARTKAAELMAEGAGLSAYFGEQSALLWRRKIDRLAAQLAKVQMMLGKREERINDAKEEVEARHADYVRVGGDRIETLRKELEAAKARFTAVNGRASKYQSAARALELDPSLDIATFEHNRKLAKHHIEQFAAQQEQARSDFGAASGRYGNIQNTLRDYQREHEEISKRPGSAIDPRQQHLRDEMAETLGIARDELVFIGELVEVNDEHHIWQGAIERALGGLRTTLAVPGEHYSKVTHWLNARHTGLHVRAQVTAAVKGVAPFLERGFLRKLKWRQHRYREWVKHHLARFDLHCVADTKALDQTPFSMTRAGLIHREQGRFEKRDLSKIDDRRDWCLGFSNATRLALLATDIKMTQAALDEAMATVQTCRHAMDSLATQLRQWERIDESPWNEINAPYWEQRCARLRADIAALETAHSSAAQALARWEAAKQKLATAEERLQRVRRLQWKTQSDHEQALQALGKAEDAAANGLDDAVRERLHKRIGELSSASVEHVTELEHHHRQRIHGEREKAAQRQTSAGNASIAIISRFRARWELIAGEWAADLPSVPQYLDYLSKLEKEGLPALVEQFTERLNRHATQSLAALREKIESERDAIRERIGVINAVLSRTEFRDGSFLRLLSNKEQFPHVRHFEQQLRIVFEQATSGHDPEARFSQLRKVIALLEKASTPATAHTLESLRLLDPRYQMTFLAEEINRDDDSSRDIMTSSSGKSGGEKEAFAGTIVAASLAYVLTPDGADKPIYCTVFLDEAFSNTAEAVSRRVLRVFRELNIHVNLITPFKNLNLARESARALIITERDMTRHESRLCEITWEELDQRQAEAVDSTITMQAEALGIELATHP